jgi:hypothetical protein
MRNIMRAIILLILSLTCTAHIFAQNEDKEFIGSKGKWPFPLNQYESLDSIGRDCFGQRCTSLEISFIARNADSVFAVHSGEVIADVEYNGSYMLMLKYESYFLVYDGIQTRDWAKGQYIEQGKFLGLASKSIYNDGYELQLTLMKGQKIISILNWFNWDTAHNIGLPKQPLR